MKEPRETPVKGWEVVTDGAAVPSPASICVSDTRSRAGTGRRGLLNVGARVKGSGDLIRPRSFAMWQDVSVVSQRCQAGKAGGSSAPRTRPHLVHPPCVSGHEGDRPLASECV